MQQNNTNRQRAKKIIQKYENFHDAMNELKKRQKSLWVKFAEYKDKARAQAIRKTI